MDKPKAVMLGLLALIVIQVQAQKVKGIQDHLNEPSYTKPQLFGDLPTRMPLTITELPAILKSATGSKVSLLLNSGFRFDGILVSKSDAGDAAVESIVVRSTNRLGAVLSFSKIRIGQQTIYRGRIISTNNSDSFDIKFENDEYVLVKKGLYDSLNE